MVAKSVHVAHLKLFSNHESGIRIRNASSSAGLGAAVRLHEGVTGFVTGLLAKIIKITGMQCRNSC